MSTALSDAAPAPHEDPELHAAIAADRLRKHAQAGVSIVVGTLLVALVVSLQFETAVDGGLGLAWWAALVLVVGLRLLLPRWHGRWPADRLFAAYRTVFALHGLLWLATGWLLAQVNDDHAIELLMVALAMLAGSALVVTAFDIVTAWCFAVPALLGLQLSIALTTARFNPLLPALLLTVVAPLAVASRRAGLRGLHIVMHRLDEQRSRAAERRMAELMDRVGELADVAGWEYDFGRRELIWTPQARRLLGWGEDEQPSLARAMERVSEPCRVPLRKAVAQAQRDGQPFEIELELRRSDGSTFVAQVQCRAQQTGGQVHRLTGALRDVTQSRRAEEDLQAYRTILNSIADSASIIREDHVYRMVNDAWCRQTGMQREEVVGRALALLPGGAISEARRRALEACLSSGTVQQVRAREPGIGGDSIFESTYYPHGPDRSGRRHCIVITRDVTQAERDRQALAQGAEYLRRTLNATADGIFASDAMDSSQPVRFVNDRMLRMWGIPLERGPTLTPQGILDAATPLFAEPERELKRIGEIIAGNLDAEDILHLRDGRVLLRSCTAATGVRGPIRVWAFRDITVQEQAHAALVAARDEAEAANRAKSLFLSQMSHELRTPLNAILGFAQLLQLGAEHGRAVDQATCVREILRGGRHLLGLISDLLDLARIESGRLEVHRAAVQVRPLLDEVLALMRPLADSHNVSLRASMGDALDDSAWADAMRLKQVLLNLLGNAVKYNRSGGSVQVRVQRDGDGLRIGVVDDGPGLSEEQQARLFRPFERLGAAGGTVEGTGIGLALSRLLVQAMGGEIGVDSQPGQGSCFWVRLPRPAA